MDLFIKYLIVINCITLLLSSICILVTRKKSGERLAVLRSVLSFAGGSAGNLIAFLLFDRKATKENMTVLVTSASNFVIYLVVVFALYGPYSINPVDLFENLLDVNMFFVIYLSAANLICFILFAVDKLAALKGKRRIPIVVLLGASAMGGTLGGLIAMYLLRHKTKKSYFSLGMPMILAAQFTLILYLIGLGIL